MHPGLLNVYRKTCYQVGEAKAHIGRRCLALDQLLTHHRMREAAFITAYNPFSQRRPAGHNLRMQSSLLQMLRTRTVVPAIGFWRSWSEVHVMVLGDTRPVRKLARRFRQNGIVTVRLRQPPKLLMIA